MAHYLFAGCEWALCLPLQGSCCGHMVSQIAMLEIKDCVTVGAKGIGNHTSVTLPHLERGVEYLKCLVQNFNHFWCFWRIFHQRKCQQSRRTSDASLKYFYYLPFLLSVSKAELMGLRCSLASCLWGTEEEWWSHTWCTSEQEKEACHRAKLAHMCEVGGAVVLHAALTNDAAVS